MPRHACVPLSAALSRRRFVAGSALAAAGAMFPFGTFARLKVPAAPEPQNRDQGLVFDRITLEMSLKPFRSVETRDIRAVCARVFEQWAPLLKHAPSCSVMLWTADGSEILDYQGKLDAELDWACYIGTGNPNPEALKKGPAGQNLHEHPWLYTEHPPTITYRTLRKIVSIIKEVGREMTGKPVFVGATFDPGPEFAPSSFKYQRHPEIAQGNTMGANRWVACDAVLSGDTRPYAGFPKGIPAGTTMGTFLGRQSQHFLKDLGFDYLWLSNGFGFSLTTWDVKGVLFDGKTFDASRAVQTRERILGFWRDFRKECRRFPVETRGSNLSLGADLSSGGSPVADIYRGNFNMVPPPNSPWAALDGDFGLEIVGYLSRIAELPPEGKLPFRYYLHDPWWLNSPWLDRYGRDPHDIYLPLALARLDEKGRVTHPSTLNLLTVDDSYGAMPEQVPDETIPHLLTAMRDYSDEPGLVTWICPFREYHEMVFGAEGRLAEPFFADWFLRDAVNAGFPLNSVVSSEHFLEISRTTPDRFQSTILVSRVPDAGSALEEALLKALQRSNKVFLYGPLARASRRILEALNLRLAEPLDGECSFSTTLPTDQFTATAQPFSARLNHRSLTSAGGVDTVVSDVKRSGVEVCATVRQGAKERIYAVFADQAHGGALAWVRGSFCCSIGSARLPVPDDPTRLFRAQWLMRWILVRFGYEIRFTKPTLSSRDPLVLAARHNNGFFFSGYCPSTAVSLSLRFPHGAPLFVGRETFLQSGRATYSMPRAWHHEARCFVEQTQDGEISCVERYSGHVGIQRRLWLRGLKAATVHIYPPMDRKRRILLVPNDLREHADKSLPHEAHDNGRRLTVRNVTGELLVSW